MYYYWIDQILKFTITTALQHEPNLRATYMTFSTWQCMADCYFLSNQLLMYHWWWEGRLLLMSSFYFMNCQYPPSHAIITLIICISSEIAVNPSKTKDLTSPMHPPQCENGGSLNFRNQLLRANWVTGALFLMARHRERTCDTLTNDFTKVF